MYLFDKNRKFVAAVLLFVFMLAGCGGAEERKAKYLERGKAYFEEENYDKARVEFKNVLQIDPKSAGPYFYLGKIEEAKSIYEGLLEQRLILKFDPNNDRDTLVLHNQKGERKKHKNTYRFP